jgi:DNA uptake protein ComE-like DNA-binding protein
MKEYWVPIALGVGSLVCIVVSVIFIVTSIQNTKPIEFSDACEDTNETSHNLCSLLRSGSTSQNEQTSDSALISINSASQLELELLPGVGPATAKKIIANRPYEIIDDLVNEKVMGQTLFEKVKIFLQL